MGDISSILFEYRSRMAKYVANKKGVIKFNLDNFSERHCTCIDK